MSLKASAKSGNFELPKMGCFQGVIFAVYDGGMQDETYQGVVSKVQKMKFGIELNLLYDSGQYEGQRVTRYPEYTVSLSQKSKLLPVVEAIIKRALTEDEKDEEKGGFELEDLIGKNCAVTITHKTSAAGREYAVDHISALMDGMKEIQPILKPDYKPDFILKWIDKGQHGEKESFDSQSQNSVNMTKAQMYNAITDNLKKYPEKRDAFKSAYIKAGGQFEKVNEEAMTALYWDFGVDF